MGCPTVRKGAKGELTRWIQKRLSLYLNVWSEGGQTDGIFGEKTEQNIRNFQKTKGLSAEHTHLDRTVAEQFQRAQGGLLAGLIRVVAQDDFLRVLADELYLIRSQGRAAGADRRTA